MTAHPPRLGFSLVEILVAIAIGVALTTVAISALSHTRAVAARCRSLVASAQTAENMLRTISWHMEPMHPACLFAAEANTAATAAPGPDGSLGTADDRLPTSLSLTWMCSMPSRWEANSSLETEYRTDFAWCRLEWSRDAATGRGRLRFARTSPRREMKDPTGPVTNLGNYGVSGNWGNIGSTTYLEVSAQPRRDHRRDMNDNALTWMPGISAATLAAVAWMGDELNLQANLVPMHPDMYTIDTCAFRWTRRNGDLVTMDIDKGIVITDASGTGKAGTGSYDSTARQVVDGVYNDGSDPAMAGRTARVGEERPLRVEIHLSMIDEYVLGSLARRGTALHSEYWISIPLDPVGSSYAQ